MQTPPVSAQPEKSEAVAKADALIEDLRRREAAMAKASSENSRSAATAAAVSTPATPADRTPATTQAPPSAAPAPAPVEQPTVAPAAPATRSRDEKWWKEQIRSLQAALDEATAKLAEADKANFKYGYNDAQAEYKKRADAVAAARQAVDRLHDEARRAGVPPGWLRLP
jgi:hypothetical protein